MSVLNYEDLFKPYTDDGHTLDAAMKYWAKEATRRGISTEVMELAINEVFTGISNGKEYPKNRCPCGCGIDKAATALIHTVVSRMADIDKEATVALKNLMQNRFDLVIQEQMKRISKTNKQYIKMNQPPLSERSPVLRGVRSLWRLIFSR